MKIIKDITKEEAKQMKIIKDITKEVALTGVEFEHVALKNADKTPLRARRNGATKTWKRYPNEFRIPVKYGMYKCFYITPQTAHQWVCVG